MAPAKPTLLASAANSNPCSSEGPLFESFSIRGISDTLVGDYFLGTVVLKNQLGQGSFDLFPDHNELPVYGAYVKGTAPSGKIRYYGLTGTTQILDGTSLTLLVKLPVDEEQQWTFTPELFLESRGTCTASSLALQLTVLP
jgi:hypothetical protein